MITFRPQVTSQEWSTSLENCWFLRILSLIDLFRRQIFMNISRFRPSYYILLQTANAFYNEDTVLESHVTMVQSQNSLSRVIIRYRRLKRYKLKPLKNMRGHSFILCTFTTHIIAIIAHGCTLDIFTSTLILVHFRDHNKTTKFLSSCILRSLRE